MDDRTLTALKKSIEHWRENVNAENFCDISIDSDNCALCQEFALKTKSCDGCPVHESSGDGCETTPWRKVADLYYEWEYRLDRGRATEEAELGWKKVAQAELDFLIGFLPEGEG